jgi:low affinity Fe/Cu permease
MSEPTDAGPGRRAARAARAAGSVSASGLGRTLQHPADRIDDRRGRFDQFAERASFLASSSLFFIACGALVLAWGVGLILGASDRFVAATAGGMSAVTLILVAVLKNSELRTERALHTKLDAIASALLEERRGHQGDAEEQLERSIGVHDEI